MNQQLARTIALSLISLPIAATFHGEIQRNSQVD